MVSVMRCWPIYAGGNCLGIALPTVLIFLMISSLILLGVLQEALYSLRLTSLDLRMVRAERLMISAQDRMEAYLRGDVTTADIDVPLGFTLSSQWQERDCPNPDGYCRKVTIVIEHQLKDVARVWQGIWYETSDSEGADSHIEAGWLP